MYELVKAAKAQNVQGSDRWAIVDKKNFIAILSEDYYNKIIAGMNWIVR